MARGMPRMDPRTMRKFQKQTKTEELKALEVRIKLPDRTLLFKTPAVTMTQLAGQETYVIMGTPEEVAEEEKEKSQGPVIPQGDIKLVAERAGVSEAEAREALIKSGGDIAEAIIRLKG